MSSPRLLFLALHQVTNQLLSGGEILFANIASQMRKMNPEYRISVLAPGICRPTLEPYFDEVIEITEPAADARSASRSHLNLFQLWSRRAAAAKRTLRRLRPEVVYCTADFFPNTKVAAEASGYGATWIGVCHHLNAPPFLRRTGALDATASYVLQRWSLRGLTHADAVFLLNSETKRALLRMGFQAERLFVVGGAVDLDNFPLLPVPEKRNRVLWLHRLSRTKGIFDLPQLALLLQSDVTFDVVGGYRESEVRVLLNAIRDYGLTERVTVHGYVDQQQLRSLLRRANAFISMSYEEGWGISLCEALASGIPCVSYALPSHQEVFGDVIGTVPLGDINGFASELQRTLNAEDRTELRIARRRAVERFSYRQLAATELRIIRDAARSRGASA